VGEEAARELLEVAIGWSQVGRVLITTRQGELGRVGYETRGSVAHRQLMLTGLGTVGYPDDAIDLCKALWAVPSMLGETVQPMPERSALVSVLEQVAFHPLSIKLVVEQLRLWRVAAVGQALERLLAAVPEGQSKDRCLIASLNLSLERLGTEEREWVKRLGVFQGGTMEDSLLVIAEIPAEQWHPLRQKLKSVGLLTEEVLLNIGVPYLKLHPTLAPALWEKLERSQQNYLMQRYRKRYYSLSGLLYEADDKSPHESRDIARRELPNLMTAVRSALDLGDEKAGAFVNRVNRFLNYFGMNRDRENFTKSIKAISNLGDFWTWYLALTNEGDQLIASGQAQQALSIFEEVQQKLGYKGVYEYAITLVRLGKCWSMLGKLDSAADFFYEALANLRDLTLPLVQSPTHFNRVKQAISSTQLYSGDIQHTMGRYEDARSSYEASLAIAQEIEDHRQEAVINFQLGSLAMTEGNFQEAQQLYYQALTRFQMLGEPSSEAAVLHQMGVLHQEKSEWDEAQTAYRKSAEINEKNGNLSAVAKNWNQLAIVLTSTGKLLEAEAYYRKAIDTVKQSGDKINSSKWLSNLAHLLSDQGDDRLSEARQLAEEALEIKRTIDPAAAEIWKTYTTLADISVKQGDQIMARNFRCQSRHSYGEFEASKNELLQYKLLIQSIISAINDADYLPDLEAELQIGSADGWGNLVAAIRRILAGERDEDELCWELDRIDSLIVGEVLRKLRS